MLGIASSTLPEPPRSAPVPRSSNGAQKNWRRAVGRTALERSKIAAQSLLTHLGARCPERVILGLDHAVDYLEAGRWLRAHGFVTGRRFTDRSELFDLAVQAAGPRTLYLEFGVGHGHSMRYWSSILADADAMLHGFDSFEGLPETWNAMNPKGQFSTNGAIPSFDDPRVRIHKGWFEQTLAHYEWPPHQRLIVNIDADLYSSTKCVLGHVAPYLEPGSLLYFDEFIDRHHELRAFAEFLDETGMTFELRGATRRLVHVLFERVA